MDMSYNTSDGVPIRTGVLAGVGAFVVGLILTFLMGTLGLSRGLALLVGIAPLQGTIVSYSAFHLWPLVMGSGSMGGFLVWTILPIVLLIVAGYAVASGTGDRSSGFKNGASVTAGYLLLTVLAFLLLIVMGGRAGSVQIGQLVVGIIFTGILFPVVFGGIGGAIADAT